jgi:phage-related protein
MEKFDFEYKNAWRFGTSHKTLITPMEGGKEQRRSKGVRKRYAILEFEKTSNYNNDAQNVLDFFDRHKGKAESFLFDYKNPDGTVEEIEMRFDQDNIEIDAFKTDAHTFTLNLIEVI